LLESLIKRMQGYRSSATNAERGGSTNIKNNRNIIDALAIGASVYITFCTPCQSNITANFLGIYSQVSKTVSFAPLYLLGTGRAPQLLFPAGRHLRSRIRQP
jgi:hypothetical protein